MAQVVYAGATAGAVDGALFAGKKFWFSQKLPQRSHFIDLVKTNGGEVVPLEQHADIKIVDPLFKKNIPPDSYSYTFIEKSVRDGELQDLEEHKAGPEAITSRPVSSQRPTKGTRLPYSAEDDRCLYDWVTSHERSGGKIQGNLIYQQLEQINPRHPWQSWRDRWVKVLSQRPKPPQSPAKPPTPLAEKSPDKTADERVCARGSELEKPVERGGETAEDVVEPSKELDTSNQQSPLLSPTALEDSKERAPSHISEERQCSQEVHPTSTGTGTTVAEMGTKRKRVEEGAELITGPTPPTAKRTRPRRKSDDSGREIPSTPELGPSSPPQAPVLPGIAEDQESESETLPPLSQVISKSLAKEDPYLQSHERATQSPPSGIAQVIDFDLAEPEGGWDKILPGDSAAALSGQIEPPVQPSHVQDTQALLHGPTQILDFELAEPEGGWDKVLPGHTLPQHATRSPQPPSQDTIDTEKQLGAWIDAHIAAGASEDNVLLALKCSSMHTGLAEFVLKSLAGGRGIPEDTRGIWTEREDEALRGGDGRAIKILEEKHGREAFQMRWNFLTSYDQLEDRS
ncbi:hypothetical protein GP486_005417 [Trichoglossum hirsutum]|uniref:DNA-binding protein RAP1 n=1 Tax=Trichoglossum hirsutum TaxID=265104 RepID=A0A9P8L9I7_9PEZI|nr:hypothetical protein GP486_005417 [Trichoglossum hirsutum]